MSDLNRVMLVGRLTRDPEVRHTAGGMPITSLRLAFSTRQKGQSGDWEERSNYINVTMFGDRFERLAQHLEKGRRVGIDGSLRWREWEADGGKRQDIEVIADNLQFLDARGEGEGGGSPRFARETTQAPSDLAPAADDFAPVGASSSAADDDIPF